MLKKPLGVLAMAYGTPKSLADVEAYYTHIRHGRPPTLELLAELIGRYEAIGGLSPLNEITQAQANGLEDALNAGQGEHTAHADSEPPYKVYLGMKHVSPFIDDTLSQMAEDGIEQIVSLVLAPHYSSMSVGVYQKTAQEAAQRLGLDVLPVLSWHLHPGFLELLAQRVQESLNQFSRPNDVMVVFTAHSLPEKILAQNDPYPVQLKETGEAVAAALDLPHYTFGWQSAGRTADPWLGPDILTVLRNLREEGWEQVLVCPAGFVSDHLEVLYDLDIEAKKLATELGIEFARTRSLNADDGFLQTLADVVRNRQQAASQEAQA